MDIYGNMNIYGWHNQIWTPRLAGMKLKIESNVVGKRCKRMIALQMKVATDWVVMASMNLMNLMR